MLLTLGAMAQPRLHDPFAIAATNTLDQGGWTLVGTTGNTVIATAGSLSYGGTLGNGHGNKATLTTSGRDYYRTFTLITPTTYASALVNVTSAGATGDFFMALGSATVQAGRLYVRSNGAGFSFGVGRSTGAPVYESTVRTFGATYFTVLKYRNIAGVSNDLVDLYVDPSPLGTEPGTATVAYTATGTGTPASGVNDISAIWLMQGVAANAAALSVDAITVSTTWAMVSTAQYDYGDAPASYDNRRDDAFAQPALHFPLAGLRLGATGGDAEGAPNSVTAGADNNSSNGDGVDEDGIATLPTLVAGGPQVNIPVNYTAPAGTKYLYAWLDLNGDGKFQLGEESTLADNFTGTTGTLSLIWSAAQMATIAAGTTKIYLRLRLSSAALLDATTGGATEMDERSTGNGAIAAANSNNGTVITSGEVEDYRLDVASGYDFGDAPATAENDKDGTARPAIHANNTAYRLGTAYDAETAPASVATGADNNGASGDGADEDALAVLPTVYRNASGLTVPVAVRAPAATAANAFLYGWLDFNGDGRFQSGEAAAASFIGTGAAQTVNLTWTAAQLAAITNSTSKIYLRLRLSSAALSDFTTAASGGATIDERSIRTGVTPASAALATPEYNVAITGGEVEDYQLDLVLGTDYGDAPNSGSGSTGPRYEKQFDGTTDRPAAHNYNAALTLGIAFDGETAPASGTTATGDDAAGMDDEDALITPPTLRSGSAGYTLPVSLRAPTGALAIYGWIDFDNDGRFEATEASAVTSFTGTGGAQTVNLTWTALQLSGINPSATALYARVRLSSFAMADWTGPAGSTTGPLLDERSIGSGVTTASAALAAPVYVTALPFGEVEDYQLVVASAFDYGDAPNDNTGTPAYRYDRDAAGTLRPALHTEGANLRLGATRDGEPTAASVTAGASNNGTNGDGADEDGIATLPTVFSGGSGLTIPISVTSPTAIGTKYIFAWIDLDGDGLFELGEESTLANSFTATGTTTLNLTWSAAQMALVPAGTAKIYLRVRLSGTDLIDATDATLDERSVGNGAAAAANTANAALFATGEVEDYQLDVVSGYDFGDAPAGYENAVSGTPTIRPAVHGYLATLRLGAAIDGETAPASSATATGDDAAGTDDEDAIITMPNLLRGSIGLTVPAMVTAPIAAGSKFIYAWIDLNNDGVFQTTELATTGAGAFTNATIYDTVLLSWAAAQISSATIPASAANLTMRIRVSSTALIDWAGSTQDERAIGNGAVANLASPATNANNAATLALGEVEDHQIPVLSGLDYGDAPNDGTLYLYEKSIEPTVADRPAVHAYNPNLILGSAFDGETALVNNVAANADNNAPNGDGSDENGLLALPNVYRGGKTLQVPVTVRSVAASNLYAWIDFNNNGRMEATELGSTSATVASTAVAASPNPQTVTLFFNQTQLGTIPAGMGNVYMRIRLSSIALIDFTGGGNGSVVDERSLGNGAVAAANPASNAANAATIAYGEVEDYRLPVLNGTDYGDAPLSFENSNPVSPVAGIPAPTPTPAVSGFVANLSLGVLFDGETAPASVTAPAANNDGAGDDAAGIDDEDGLVDLPTVYAGGDALDITVSITAPAAAGNKYLYGWLDLNGDGRFSTNELGSVVGAAALTPNLFTATGPSAQTLRFTSAQLNGVLASRSSIYLRLRLTDAALTDNATTTLVDERSIANGTNTTAFSFGEVEDYQLPVLPDVDYGDAPVTYERISGSTTMSDPAKHSSANGLTIGATYDGETGAQSVATGANNNGTNGDGADEDGFQPTSTTLDENGNPFVVTDSVYRGGEGHTITVALNSPVGAGDKFLYAWLDLNGDGRFQPGEANTNTVVAMPTTVTGSFSRQLTWSTAQLATIPASVSQLYLRIRYVQATALTDVAATTDVDERAIGNGGSLTTLRGEVEDYVLPVAEGFDYGDLPLGYDQQANGTTNRARHGRAVGFTLGTLRDAEATANNVAAGTDNNNNAGDNLIYAADEDALNGAALPVVYKQSQGFTLAVPVNNPGGTKYLYGWLDIDGDGRMETAEAAAVVTFTAAGSSTQTLSWTAAQLAAPGANTQVYLRLRLSNVLLTDYTGAAGGATLDERSIGGGVTVASAAAATPDYNAPANLGEVEDYRLNFFPGTDFGDLPITYEKQSDGTTDRPAVHYRLEGLTLGTALEGEDAPSSVAAGADNNTTNGDGAEEDALSVLPLVFRDAAFSLTVPVNNPSAGTRYLYGWLDLNGDGKFQRGEAGTGPASVTAVGTTTQTLTWSLAAIQSLPPANAKIYLRLRWSNVELFDYIGLTGNAASLANGALIDERSIGSGVTTASAATATLVYSSVNVLGEVEDYQLGISNGDDYGDAPSNFDRNENGAFTPARNAPSQALRLAGIADPEEQPQSVAFTYSNNGAEGDGSDENGIASPLPTITINQAFTVQVRATNLTGAAANLHGWLDLNGDAVFQPSERVTVAVATGTSNGLVSLTWTAAQTNNISADKLYLRLRLTSNTNITSSGSTPFAADRVTTGDGNNTAAYGTQVFRGEVEDYQITAQPAYDYGDLPSTYEQNGTGINYPARHRTVTTGATALYLGHNTDLPTDNESGPQEVSSGSSANGANGDGGDENGVAEAVLAQTYAIGGNISVPVKVFKAGATAATLYGWLDQNGDGRFDASEVRTATLAAASTGNQTLTLTWNNITSADVMLPMRLRFVSGVLTDGGSIAFDSRSLGHGNAAGDYTGAAPNGEVEDYTLTTSFTALPGNVECDFLYGKVQSSFHSTIALGPDGIYKIWGDGTGVGTSYANPILSPVNMDKKMYPALTGDILKATLSSNSIGNTVQVVVLSGDGLFAHGEEARVLPNALTTSTTFQKITAPANGEPTTGLPLGVTPADVRYMTATPGTLMIMTTTAHGGHLYTLGSSNVLYGDRTSNTAADALWHRVSGFDGTPLEGVQHAVVSINTGFAADASGAFYTWGSQQYIGDGTAANAASGSLPANSGTGGATNFWRARPMSEPTGFGANVQMIAVTGLTGSYLALDNNGNVYSMGSGAGGIMGNGSTANRPTWGQVMLNATTAMTGMRTIAANDQDLTGHASAAATGRTGAFYTWGYSSRQMLGHPEAAIVFGRVPSGFAPAVDRANYTEVGGHTTVLIKDGSSKYCYVGHRVNGSMGDGTAADIEEPAFNCTQTGAAKVACAQLLDAGDVPTSFENGLGDNRAVHSFFYDQNVRLGTVHGDDEYGRILNVGAGADNEGTNGDGSNENVDEDGVIKGTYDGSGTYSMTVSVRNVSGVPANVYGWVDWNANGIFESEEAATATVPSNAGANQTATLTWTNAGDLECNTVNATRRSYTRVRVTTRSLTDASTTVFDERSLGAAPDGEIEDGFLEWEFSQIRDYGNIENSPSIFWPIAFATVLETGTRVWAGDNSDAPTPECDTDINDANTSGLSLTGTDLTGNGTRTTPYEAKVGQTYTVTLSLNSSAAGTQNVEWGLWIDTDGNGRFDEAADLFETGIEAITNGPANGAAAETFSVSLPPTLAGNANAKIRLVVTGENVAFTKAQNGEVEALNGEVEDYYLILKDPAGIFVSGKVWDDANGNVTQDGTEPETNAGGTLYVNLVDDLGNVVGSVAVASDGSYALQVPLNKTGYKLVLTTSPTSNTPMLPNNWINTGDAPGSQNTAAQGSTRGIIELNTGVTDITIQNFAIEQLPTATPVTGPNQNNPGGNLRVTVPELPGFDPEDGPYPPPSLTSTLIINTLPDAALGILYYDGVAVTANQTITNYDPSKMTFDPVDGSMTVSFTFSVVDAAGQPSAPATASFPITGYDFGDLDVITWPVASAILPTYKITGGVPDNYNAATNPQVIVWAGAGINVEPSTREGGSTLANKDGFDDGLGVPPTLGAGVDNTFTVTMNANQAGTTVYYRLWFDWNADGNFANDVDAEGNPATYAGSGVTSSPITVTVNVRPPVGASIDYKVRLVVSDVSETSAGAIPDFYRIASPTEVIELGIGEVEDYSQPVPLPVTGLEFTVRKLGALKGEIAWRTSTEINTRSFTVERSANGRDFTPLGTVAAAGNSTTERQYKLEDATPLVGANYYRLVTTNLDGSRELSAVRVLNFDRALQVLMYPNPATNQTLLTGVEPGMRVEVYGPGGQIVLRDNIRTYSHTLNVAQLAAGSYRVVVLSTSGLPAATLQLVKQ